MKLSDVLITPLPLKMVVVNIFATTMLGLRRWR
ncbi:hypothetical protein PQA64_gp02 [Burkholderia phage PhiBP82.2]|nr:hypothetical protein PQA64_gp02 [Burkholderia phage PhiBP82.2]UKM53761.1 hypothetical protein PhiBP822_03 [Burkholderia phage PhiBP82.2]